MRAYYEFSDLNACGLLPYERRLLSMTAVVLTRLCKFKVVPSVRAGSIWLKFRFAMELRVVFAVLLMMLLCEIILFSRMFSC